MADEPCLEAGTFRVDRLTERMAARKKYYGFPLKDAPFLVPYVDFQQEHEDGQFGRYFFGGLECIGPDACWRLTMNIDYAFDSGHRYGDPPPPPPPPLNVSNPEGVDFCMDLRRSTTTLR